MHQLSHFKNSWKVFIYRIENSSHKVLKQMGITIGTFRIPNNLRDSMWISFCSTSVPIKLHRRKQVMSTLWVSRLNTPQKARVSINTFNALSLSQPPFQLVSSFPFVVLSAFWSISFHPGFITSMQCLLLLGSMIAKMLKVLITGDPKRHKPSWDGTKKMFYF